MSKKLTKKSTSSSSSKVSDTNNVVSVDDSDVLDSVETELMKDDMDADPILEDDNTDTSVEDVSVLKSQLVERETTIGTKTYQTGGYVIENDGVRLDTVYVDSEAFESDKKKQKELLGGTITVSEDNTVLRHYEGVLGSFDYNPNSWAIGTKEVTNPEGTVTATIPVLRYIGDAKHGNDIKIPEGVKSLDYTFEGNDEIETVPVIPDSVESAHCAFMGCTSITRACKDAKDGEKGFTFFQNDTVKGQEGIGGNFSLNPFAWGNADGKGGIWTMSDGLKDASGMFYDCTALTESYTAAGKSLMFAQDMYRNTTKMGSDETALLHGSSARMDCTQSLMLTPSATNGMYDGSNVDVAKSYVDLDNKNYSIYWDEATGSMDTYQFYKVGGTDKELQAIRDLENAQKRDQVLFGGVQTDMYSVTGGQANHATVRDTMGYSSTSNVKDENTSNHYSEGVGTENLDNMVSGKQSLGSGGLIDRGLVSLGEYGLLKKLTGSSLLSFGITAGGQLLGILPKSMKPILDPVIKFVGADSVIGKALTSLSNVFAGLSDEPMSLDQQKESLEKDDMDETTAETDVRVLTDMQAPIDVAVSDQTADITKRMTLNGATIAKDHVLLTVANKDENDSELLNIKLMMEEIAKGLEEKTNTLADENGGVLSEEDKQQVALQYQNVINGLAAYDDGAKSSLRSVYVGDISNQEKAERGLGKIMRLSVVPIYDSILKLNEKYHFLSDENMRDLNAVDLTGCVSLDEYECGMDMAPEEDIDVERVEAAQEALDQGKTLEEAKMIKQSSVVEDENTDVVESVSNDVNTVSKKRRFESDYFLDENQQENESDFEY